jgi:YVTN family beta-propeller protein
VDLITRQVIGEVSTGDRPYGVLVSPDGKRLYVAEQGSDRLRILDTGSLDIIAVIPVADRPSGLAISQDGRTLYITHLLASALTVLDTSQPYAAHLPLVLNDSPATGSENDRSTRQSAISAIPLWPDSNLVQSVVIAPDGRTAYVPHTRSNSANRALTFDTTVFPLVSLIDLETDQHLIGQQLDLGTLDPPGVGLPFDAAITPDGNELWVLNAASNDVTVLALATRQSLAHIEVGHNPRGIVLSPDGARAYVNNTLAGTVSVLDTAAYTVTATITTTQIPLPPLLLEGKRLFNSSDDPRMSKAQWIACATCHFEGEHDGRTWFFGFAGPRNTTSLSGMIQTYPLRWSGEWNESADAEFAIRKENFGAGLLTGAMNCSASPPDCVHQPPNQGRDDALDALAAFMDALPLPLSPAHANGQPLTALERRGQALFHDPALGCVDCHPAPLYTDQQPHDVGTASAGEKIGPEYDTPSLRALYDSAPYFHDGSAATLYETLTRPSPGSEHDVSDLLSQADIQALISYLQALPFEH